jgi:hypothetical protein
MHILEQEYEKTKEKYFTYHSNYSKIDTIQRMNENKIFFLSFIFNHVIKDEHQATLPSCQSHNEQHNQHLTFDADQPKKLHHPKISVGLHSAKRDADSVSYWRERGKNHFRSHLQWPNCQRL